MNAPWNQLPCFWCSRFSASIFSALAFASASSASYFLTAAWSPACSFSKSAAACGEVLAIAVSVSICAFTRCRLMLFAW